MKPWFLGLFLLSSLTTYGCLVSVSLCALPHPETFDQDKGYTYIYPSRPINGFGSFFLKYNLSYPDQPLYSYELHSKQELVKSLKANDLWLLEAPQMAIVLQLYYSIYDSRSYVPFFMTFEEF